MKPRDLTPAESDAYDERVAICTTEGISEQRAHAIALEQVRPAKQWPLLLGFERVTMEDVRKVLK